MTISRDQIEEILISRFPEIRSLQETDMDAINALKNGNFGFSYLGFLLYANGQNLRGKSTKYPQGLLYNDGRNIFGVGFYKKEISENQGHIHIIAPHGPSILKIAIEFIRKIQKFPEIPKNSMYVRHLSKQQYEKLLFHGYQPIEKNPWHLLAPSEDETFNHRLVTLSDIVEHHDHELKVRVLQNSENTRDFRRKGKMAYKRFQNFLKRNKVNLEMQRFTSHHTTDAENLIRRHFKMLSETGIVVGSTPEDYLNILHADMSGDQFFPFVGYLNGKLAMVFIGEKITTDTVGLYVSFTSRDKDLVRGLDATGFSAMSQYCYLRFFDIVSQKGIRFVDLGGSEVKNLDDFKRQLGAQERKSYWVVANI